ncbi:MAG: M56 family metallopeptidase [Actinobacteria bacterium]|jgi:Zn-dependent protease with chaperone function|nr:M56 family metallopeptidase [Actinomycetota bacterium]
MTDFTTLAELWAAPSAALVFTVVPWLLGRKWTERASARMVATSELVVLLGWALLPVMGVFCLGEAIASWSVAPGMAGSIGNGACWLGLDAASWRLLGYVLALIALLPLGVGIWRTARAVRNFEVEGELYLESTPLVLPSGGEVFVLPTVEVAAYAGGVLRPRAVVTRGLVDPLAQKEREAVCEHELAHVRLGHPRVLLLGTSIYRIYGFLPPVRWAYKGLRCSLEASADDEAVRWVGRSTLVSALAQVVLMQAGNFLGGGARGSVSWFSSEARFGDVDYLRYRLRHLEQAVQKAPRWHVNLALVMVIAGSVGILTLASCAFFDLSFTLASVATCSLSALVMTSRPVWKAGRC